MLTAPNQKARPYWPVILLLVAIKLLLPVLLQHEMYELQRDEYLYYQQGQHLSAGFLENPPLIALLGTITAWMGGAEWMLKLWPLIFGALTVILTCLIAAEFGGNRFAQFLAGFGMLTGAYMRMHYLFQPNFLDIFSWTLALYFLLRYINTKQNYFLYLLAIAIAIGWYSKYSILFLAVAMAASVLLTRHRKIITNKHLYFSLLILLLLIVPNIYWQYTHNWPLFHHMEELQSTQLKFLSPLDFIKDQFLYLLPVVFIWIAGLFWVFKTKPYAVFGWTYIWVIILLLAGSGKSYYAMGIYPMLLAAGGVAIEKFSLRYTWFRISIPVIVVLLTLPFIPMLLPLWEPPKLAAFYQKYEVEKTGLLKWEDQENHALPQDFADMIGWKELTQKTESFFQTLPDSIKDNTIVFTDSYGQAGSLKFYGKDAEFRAKVFSDNGSNLLWIPDDFNFKHIIVIDRSKPGADDEVFNHFEKSFFVDSVTNQYSRQLGDKIFFYQGANSETSKMASIALQQMKKKFSR